MKRLTVVGLSAMFAVGVSSAFAEATYVVDGNGNFVFDISNDDSYSGVLTGSGGLIKKGVGKLKLTGANTFTGAVRIEAGTLATDTLAHFGKSTSYTVLSGAAIDISVDSGSDADRASLANADITIAGTGVNGGGAIRKVTGGDHYGQTFRNLYLDGDATIHADKKYDFLNIYFQNHVLTKTGGAMVSGSSTHFYSGGEKAKIVAVGTGSERDCFNLESGNWFDGNSNNVFELKNRARIRFWDGKSSSTIPWTLYGAADQEYLDIIANGNGSSTPEAKAGYNWWSGPVKCEATLFRPQAYSTLFLHFKNTVEAKGITCSQSGTVHFMSNVTASATITADSNTHVVFDGPVKTGANLNANAGSSIDIHDSLDLGGDGSYSGTVRFSGCPDAVHKTKADWHIQAGARVEFLDAGRLELTGSKFCYFHSQDYGKPSVMVVSNTCLSLGNGGRLYVAPGSWTNPKNGCGILEIVGNSVVTGNVSLANTEGMTNGVASVCQTGGTFVHASGNMTLGLLTNTVSFWGIENGRLLSGAKLATKGRMALHLGAGGVFDTNASGQDLTLGGGDAELYLRDGAKMNYERPLVASMVTGSDAAGQAGRALVAIRGEGSRMKERDVNCSGLDSGYETIFAFSDGGSFAARRIGLRKAAKERGASLHVQVDGGIIRPLIGGALFWETDDFQQPDSFVIHDGGLVVDTSECRNDDGTKAVGELGMPIVARTGRGLKAVALPASSEFASAVYYGAPRVTISGKGTGAAAVCEFDMATRKVTGITVVSPGFGYDEGTTVTIASPRGTAQFACPSVTLTEATCTGGLVKRGDGAFTVNAGSAYSGETVCEEGKLTFGVAGAYPGGDIRLAGGEIHFNQGTTLACTVRGTCADLFSGKSLISCDGTLDVSNVTFEVSDPENLGSYKDVKPVTLFTATGSIVGRPNLAGAYGNFGLVVGEHAVRFGFRRGCLVFVR